MSADGSVTVQIAATLPCGHQNFYRVTLGSRATNLHPLCDNESCLGWNLGTLSVTIVADDGGTNGT